jgi:hypothetical protein
MAFLRSNRGMKLLERMEAVGRRRHLSPRTIRCYQCWVKNFLRLHRGDEDSGRAVATSTRASTRR